MDIKGFNVILDKRVEDQLTQFYIYPALNRKVGWSKTSRPVSHHLTVTIIHKVTRNGTTLKKLVEKIMGTSPGPSVPIAWTDGEQIFDFRAQSPEDWLAALPRDISPRLTPPSLDLDCRAIRLNGTHSVKAVVVDADFVPDGPLYAYDTASGFSVKYNSKSFIKHIMDTDSYVRRIAPSLYDFRSSAFFVVYD